MTIADDILKMKHRLKADLQDNLRAIPAADKLLTAYYNKVAALDVAQDLLDGTPPSTKEKPVAKKLKKKGKKPRRPATLTADRLRSIAKDLKKFTSLDVKRKLPGNYKRTNVAVVIKGLMDTGEVEYLENVRDDIAKRNVHLYKWVGKKK